MIKEGTIFKSYLMDDDCYYIFMRRNGDYAECYRYSSFPEKLSLTLVKLDYDALENNRELFQIAGKTDLMKAFITAIRNKEG